MTDDARIEDSHASWMREKIEAGWKYGPAKDPAKREHPCMVPYAELPVAQRAKDGLYLAVVRAVARAFDASSEPVTEPAGPLPSPLADEGDAVASVLRLGPAIDRTRAVRRA